MTFTIRLTAMLLASCAPLLAQQTWIVDANCIRTACNRPMISCGAAPGP